jgi:hypothetical protein
MLILALRATECTPCHPLRFYFFCWHTTCCPLQAMGGVAFRAGVTCADDADFATKLMSGALLAD